MPFIAVVGAGQAGLAAGYHLKRAALPFSILDIDAVVWAAGYRDETGWMDLPEALATDGSFLQSRGISPVPGLYFVGRPWQRNRASALVMGAGDDAECTVAAILADIRREQRAA